jgi:hypothetical protein
MASTTLLPTVSHVDPDGSLVELIYDPDKRATALAASRPNTAPEIAQFFDLPTGERLVPYRATNDLIASGCVLLPSAIGEFAGKVKLLADIRGFLDRYVDLTPEFAEIATHYVLLTWVYDAFNEIGYLRFRGDYGTGKTRALIAIGSLCYKPFFASGASTVSPLFHVLDVFGGTLVLDEADFRFSDSTAELTKILNNGNVAGLPVLRTMANRHKELTPRAFKVFGPKLVAMREHFSDRALESRFLTEETGSRPLPPHIPIYLPDALQHEARGLRNKLLAWRFAARHQVGPKPDRLFEGLEARLNQTALALLSIVDDGVARDRIRAKLEAEGVRAQVERASSTEATVLAVLMDSFADPDTRWVRLAEIAQGLAYKSPDDFEVPPTSKWVGRIVRHRLRLQTVKSSGTYAVPQSEVGRIKTLARRFGIVAEPSLNTLSIPS